MKLYAAMMIAVCVTSFCSPVRASEIGSREEAVAMVHAVQAMVQTEGLEKTFSTITLTDKFKDRDLYPFVYDVDGLNVAHGANPKMVGKSWISTRDQDGNFLIKEMVAIANGPGQGWINYKWPHPITHKIQDKLAYVEKLGDRFFVGVGVYAP